MNENRFRMLPLLILWICALATAQNPTGTVRGIVQDSTGARIASARVSIRLATSSSPRNDASDDRGEFHIDDLAPGAYSISVAARGFANATAKLSVEVSVTRDIEVTLKP